MTRHHQMSFLARFWDHKTRLDTWVLSLRDPNVAPWENALAKALT